MRASVGLFTGPSGGSSWLHSLTGAACAENAIAPEQSQDRCKLEVSYVGIAEVGIVWAGHSWGVVVVEISMGRGGSRSSTPSPLNVSLPTSSSIGYTPLPWSKDLLATTQVKKNELAVGIPSDISVLDLITLWARFPYPSKKFKVSQSELDPTAPRRCRSTHHQCHDSDDGGSCRVPSRQRYLISSSTICTTNQPRSKPVAPSPNHGFRGQGGTSSPALNSASNAPSDHG